MTASRAGSTERPAVQPDDVETLGRVAGALPGVIFQYRLFPDGRSCFPYLSSVAQSLFAIDPDTLREDAEPLFRRIHRADVGRIRQSIYISAELLTPWREDGRLLMPDGSIRWLEANSLPTSLDDGSVLWHGFMMDVSKRREAEEALRVAAVAFESHEAMLVCNRSGFIIRVNRAVTELTGFRPAQLLGQSLDVFISDQQHGDFQLDTVRDTLVSQGRWNGELWCNRLDGGTFLAWVKVTAVRDTQHRTTHYVAAATDITDRKLVEDRIRAMAYRDPLTGLPNRRLLDDRLDKALAAAERHGRHGALLFIDLDDFKRLNDTWGHDVGDQLLVEVARRLESNVRDTDTVARLGGDEFVVMLTDLGYDRIEARGRALTVAECLRAALNVPYRFDDAPTPDLRSSCSIGISLFGGLPQNRRTLLKQADVALYQAKEAGRNRLRFHD